MLPYPVGLVSYLDNYFHIHFLYNLNMLSPHPHCLSTTAAKVRTMVDKISLISLSHSSIFPQGYTPPYLFLSDLSSV